MSRNLFPLICVLFAQVTFAQVQPIPQSAVPATKASDASVRTFPPFTVRRDTIQTPPETTGILREAWTSVTGSSLRLLTGFTHFPNAPIIRDIQPQATAPTNWGEDHGQRLHGWLIPPVSGDYIFHIASDDAGALNLSSDLTQAASKQIAQTLGSTKELEWNRRPEQTSEKITLVAGKPYYIEALVKQGGSGDHLAIGWTPPGQSNISVIPGSALRPWTDDPDQMMPVAENLVALAGPDILIHLPLTSGELRAQYNDFDPTSAGITFGWTIVSGPRNGLSLDSPKKLAPTFTVNQIGKYVLRFTVQDAAATVSSDLVVTVKPPLLPSAGSITRDIFFTENSPELSALTNLPTFPDSPFSTDRLTVFSSPQQWSSNYGLNVHGLLLPPVSGEYTFFLSGDETAVLRLGQNANESTLREIASLSKVTRRRAFTDHPSQRSESIYLEAGSAYAISALLKEQFGNDHMDVAWLTPLHPQRASPELIPGQYLAPFPGTESAPLYSKKENLLVSAGRNRHSFAPDLTLALDGSTLWVPRASEEPVTLSWTQVSGPSGVIFSDASTEDPSVTFPGPGTYTLRLAGTSANHTQSSTTRVEIFPPLTAETGSITREVWLNVDGNRVVELTQSPAYLLQPDFTDRLPAFQGPDNWAQYYGQRITGYVHPDVTGEYTFSIYSNGASELFLSPSDDPAAAELIADTNELSSGRRFDRFPSQTSATFTLQAGRRYFIQALHKESTGSDYLNIGWDGPSTDGIETIPGGQLSPLRLSDPAFHPEIAVFAGLDARILLPENSLPLAPRVYDYFAGPSSLSYTWTGSSGVTFSSISQLNSEAQFSGPGTYTIRLTVTDGETSHSNEFSVIVDPPSAVGTGRITREVWFDIGGSETSSLEKNFRYPANPDLVENIEVAEIPPGYGDRYGQRLSGDIFVTELDDYVFAVASDDWSSLRLSLNGSRANLKEIARVTKATGFRILTSNFLQISNKVRLTPGLNYPFEVLHKEGSSNDYVSVFWRKALEPDSAFRLLGGENVVPTNPSAPVSGEISVYAGPDVKHLWPHDWVALPGFVRDSISGPQPLTYSWSVTDGTTTEVEFRQPTALSTEVRFPGPGTYTLQLESSDGVTSASDQVTITLEDDSIGTGELILERWDNLPLFGLNNFQRNRSFPDKPTRRERRSRFELNDLPQKSAAVFRGFLQVPATDDYTFYTSSSDQSQIYLSTTDSSDDTVLICSSRRRTLPGDYTREPDRQVSAPITLTAGKRYYIEGQVFNNDTTGFLTLAWSSPSLPKGIHIVQGGVLSPVPFADGTPPTLALRGGSSTTLRVGQAFVDPGVVARDETDGNIAENLSTKGTVNTELEGTYQIRYTVTDAAGNASEELVREVTVSALPTIQPSYPPEAGTTPAASTFAPSHPPTREDASRFLAQASFGATTADIDRVMALGYERWIDEQLALPASLHLPEITKRLPYLLSRNGQPQIEYLDRIYAWWTNAVTAPDQLRQRMAFALSQIFVISDEADALEDFPLGVTNYYDILVRHSAGSYRDLIGEITYSPMMGLYLTHLRSDKEVPDENYARELLQLFSIGLEHLNRDGSLKLTPSGQPIPTYDNDVIIGLGKTLTGFTYAGSDDFFSIRAPRRNVLLPMIPFETNHDAGKKQLFSGAVLPAGRLARTDVNELLDLLVAHPNVAPFLARLVIKQLVTSNPSPAYIHRVATAFETSGKDFGVMVKAILLDEEARNPARITDPTFGKMREPVIRLTNILRAYEHRPSSNIPTLDRVVISDTSDDFLQAPFRAPSVFNFYSPNFQPPGILRNAGLFAPVFEIATGPTNTSTTNYLHEGLLNGFTTENAQVDRVRISLAPLELAATQSPAAVIDHIDLLLLAGQMTPQMRQVLTKTLEQIPDDPVNQALAALQIIVTSPEFTIQK